MVPVFFKGEHIFTTCAKAHLSDTGNAIATTYSPESIDVYAEGALIFPCVKIQEHYADRNDIIRMCRKRIRVPEIWYGDYLAMLAAARVGERRIQQFCEKFGLDTVKTFVRGMARLLRAHDHRRHPRPPRRPGRSRQHRRSLPRRPRRHPPPGRSHRRLPQPPASPSTFRDNPDCTPTGLNQSRATATTAGISGILHILNGHPEAKSEIAPNNGGSFRRFDILLRENCVLGIPRAPHLLLDGHHHRLRTGRQHDLFRLRQAGRRRRLR